MYELSLINQGMQFGGTDLLRELLVKQGVPRDQIVEYQKNGYIKVSGYFKNKLEIRRVACRIKKCKLQGISLRAKDISQRDWLKEWQRSVQPFTIARHFIVVPVGSKQKASQDKKIPLYIEISLAFGTGLHATTQFMAQLIEECRGQFPSFLDIGTGSGILAILAAKCGAKRIVALDVDPVAITTARRNFRRNKVRNMKVIKSDIKSYAPQRQFDFVAANLYTHDLIRLRRKIYSLVRPGKFLAVSGIAREHFRDFQKAYQHLALSCVRICQGKQWTAILFQRIAK